MYLRNSYRVIKTIQQAASISTTRTTGWNPLRSLIIHSSILKPTTNKGFHKSRFITQLNSIDRWSTNHSSSRLNSRCRKYQKWQQESQFFCQNLTNKYTNFDKAWWHCFLLKYHPSHFIPIPTRSFVGSAIFPSSFFSCLQQQTESPKVSWEIILMSNWWQVEKYI